MSNAAIAPQGQKWIISPAADIFFFIGTPFLCLLGLLPLRTFFDSHTIAFYALALFATGHHLPGFMRAYGDPDLFNTYKEKFIVAPLVVVAVVAYSQFASLHGLFFMVLVWEIWHLFMQHYGIMRIYDSKNKIFTPINARLDWLMSVCAFLAVVLYSPEYLYRILDHNLKVGLPMLPVGLISGLKQVWLVITLIVAAAYIVNLVMRLVRRQPVSYPKVAVMATTLFIIYFAWIYIRDLTIGYAAFAVFHDIQYFAIVWIYNNSLVKRGQTSALLRKFFTVRSLPIIAAYILLSFGYGSINALEGFLTAETAITLVQVFVISSTLLHYYFDGFIWKLRQRKNQENLGISGPQAIEVLGPVHRLGSYLREGGRQVFYFAVPVLLLALVQHQATADASVARRFVELFPDLSAARNRLGVYYINQGEADKAKEAFEEAIRLDLRSHEPYGNLGLLYAQRGDSEQAHFFNQKAIDLQPAYVSALNAQGLVFMGQGKLDEAALRFERALERYEYAPAHHNLGMVFLKKEAFVEAIDAFGRAVAMMPDNPTYHFNLGVAYRKMGNSAKAVECFDQAVVLQPGYTKAYLSLAVSHRDAGEMGKARQALEALLMVEPTNETAKRLLSRF
jgi:tetratricopeptide (TPR) repeat protein